MAHFPSRPLRTFLVGALLLTLVACSGGGSDGGGGSDPGGGGGGGGGNPPPPPNSPPVADAGAARTAAEGENVVLAGTGSDSDGTVTSLTWRQLSGPGLTLDQVAGTGTAQFQVPDLDADDAARFELTVTDNDGATDTDQVEVSLLAAYPLGGTVFAAPGIDADGDVNDPEAPLARNDTFDTAQTLANPVLLGGFANVAGRGDPSGQLEPIGDENDYYLVDAVASQVVSLYIESERPAINDLDLALYDVGRNLIDQSLSVTSFEQITIPGDGRYFVEVRAFSGASNYVLRIGQGSDAARTAPGDRLLLSDPFVPGEAVVRFDETALAATGGIEAMAQSQGLRIMAGGAGRARRLDTRGWHMDGATRAFLGRAGGGNGRKALAGTAANPDLTARLETLLAIKALRRRGDVEAASPNFIRQPLLAPNDEFYSLQWHYPAISLPAAWDLTRGDASVIVAVIDTGVLTAHPDFTGKLVDGFDFISSPTNARDGDGIDADPNDPGDLANGGNSSFHGTHVAGTVGARSDDGEGVAGAGWDTRLMPLRALGRSGGTEYDINQAIRYAAGLANDSGTVPAQRADVINLSLGGAGFSAASQALVNEVRAAGVIVIAAAGNSSTSQPFYPAAYDGVLSVSAVDINGNLAGYSNFGSTIDIAAPGGRTSADVNGDGFGDGVLSSLGDDSDGGIQLGYGFLQGTSMAAPHVAGVVALMKAVYPALSPALLDAFVVGGDLTDDLGGPGRDDSFGHGLINAYDSVVTAIEAAGGVLPDPTPVLVATPPALNFGISTAAQAVRLTNGGTGDLIVDPAVVDPPVPWLTVDASGADGDGLGSYIVRVERSGLAAGTFQSGVRITSNGGDVRLSVIMQVVDGDVATGNAGNQFILLIDDSTGEVVEQAEPGILVDTAAYSFGQVLPGTYVIVGGTDHDSDGFICDAAESCGAFPVLDPLTLQTVTIAGARDDLDYVATFNSDLASDGAAAPADAGAMTVQQAVRSLLGRRGIPIRRGADVLATAAQTEASP